MLSNNHLLLHIGSVAPSATNTADGRPGTLHPLVDWSELPEAAREALESADFGAGDVLCTDRNFRKNLMKSWHGDPQELMDLLIAAEPGPNRR